MEPSDVFVGRQPILDGKQKIYAFELLFRRGLTATAEVEDDVRATASVISSVLGNMGTRKLIGDKKGFVNVDERILRSGVLDLLPKENMVYEILETVELTDSFVDLLKGLKREGFRFALDDFVYSETARPIFDLIDYLKVDIIASDPEAIEKTVKEVRSRSVVLLAEKVETREEFERLREMGFGLFQGYFFARPSIVSGKSISPALMVLMELLRLLSAEAELYRIEELFRKNPELNIKLLQLMNSATFYKHRVTSIKQSIALLGYRKLQKWATVLLFAGTDVSVEVNPLLERAAVRGRMAEFLARGVYADEETSDGAFIAGALSLADALFRMPLADAVADLSLSKEIEDALLGRTGLLGSLLSVVEDLEQNRLPEASHILEGLGLTLDDLFLAEKTAIMEYESYMEERQEASY